MAKAIIDELSAIETRAANTGMKASEAIREGGRGRIPHQTAEAARYLKAMAHDRRLEQQALVFHREALDQMLRELFERFERDQKVPDHLGRYILKECINFMMRDIDPKTRRRIDGEPFIEKADKISFDATKSYRLIDVGHSLSKEQLHKLAMASKVLQVPMYYGGQPLMTHASGGVYESKKFTPRPDERLKLRISGAWLHEITDIFKTKEPIDRKLKSMRELIEMREITQYEHDPSDGKPFVRKLKDETSRLLSTMQSTPIIRR